MRTKFAVLAGLFLLQVSNVFGGTYTDTVEKSFKLPAGSEIYLSNKNGKVEIESWDKDEVWLVAEKKVKAGSREEAAELFEKIKININSEENLLEIETIYPRRNRGFWDFVFGNGGSVSVSYRLKVPQRSDLDIKTVNGKVAASGVSGKLRFKTTNGAIRIFNAAGLVEAKTTNGSINAELLEIQENEDMTFRTTNGSIEVVFPEDLKADVEAKTTNGSVRTDFPIEVLGKMSKRKLKGTIHGGGARLILHTTNGSIRIKEQ